MKLKFVCREPAIFFHFLDSISNWSIHTRKSIITYYENRFGFSERDELIIKKYIKLRKKYPWKKLDSDFYLSNNFREVHKKLSNRLSKKEHGEVKIIINHFYPNLHKVFHEWKKHIVKRKELLKGEIKRQNLNELFREIAGFYEIKNPPKEVTVHLLVSPNKNKNSGGGGANISPNKHITLEPHNPKSIQKKYLQSDICVIAHEILHQIEDGCIRSRKDGLKKIGGKKIDLNMLNEAIADTLVPGGYLALKYRLVKRPKMHTISVKNYSKTNASTNYRVFRENLASLIYPLTKKQLEENKSIFQGGYLQKSTQKYFAVLDAQKRAMNRFKK